MKATLFVIGFFLIANLRVPPELSRLRFIPRARTVWRRVSPRSFTEKTGIKVDVYQAPAATYWRASRRKKASRARMS